MNLRFRSLQAQLVLRLAAGFVVATLLAVSAIVYEGSQAAQSLGLGYWPTTMLIILPQALKIAIPPLVNIFIAGFKDTTLVTIIGLFDLMSTASNAITDPNWRGFYVEAYSFIAVIYFLFCFFMSRYSEALERSFKRGGT